MYLIIAYHGRGYKEVGQDLRVLWQRLEDFTKALQVLHIYCFQAVRDGIGADTLIVVQYKSKDDAATKFALSTPIRQSLQTHHSINYWLYIRESKQGGTK